jgi:hypothetical protein
MSEMIPLKRFVFHSTCLLSLVLFAAAIYGLKKSYEHSLRWHRLTSSYLQADNGDSTDASRDWLIMYGKGGIAIATYMESNLNNNPKWSGGSFEGLPASGSSWRMNSGVVDSFWMCGDDMINNGALQMPPEYPILAADVQYARWWTFKGFQLVTGGKTNYFQNPATGKYGSQSWQIKSVTIPFWALALIALIMPSFWLAKALHRGKMINPGTCTKCGYDLRASHERCPECGTPIVPSKNPKAALS